MLRLVDVNSVSTSAIKRGASGGRPSYLPRTVAASIYSAFERFMGKSEKGQSQRWRRNHKTDPVGAKKSLVTGFYTYPAPTRTWLVCAEVPGLDRRAMKKMSVDEAELLSQLHR